MQDNLEFYNWDRENIFNVSPILICKLEGIDCRMLIDTGASISVLDDRFLNDNPYLKENLEEVETKVTVNMQGGGTDMSHIISTTVTTPEYCGEHDFFILPITMSDNHPDELRYDGIVGCDFLIKAGAVIDLQNFTIKLN